MWEGCFHNIHMARHSIKLIAPYLRFFDSAPYCNGPEAHQLEKAEINKMFFMDTIGPVQSGWALPIIFARKKDGSLPVWIDWKKPYSVTARTPTQLLDWTSVWTRQAKRAYFPHYSNIRYCQFKTDYQNKDKTTFMWHYGLYIFLRMPYRLKNSPSAFQSAMDTLLSNVKLHLALVNLDNFCIFPKSVEDHLPQYVRYW